MMATLRMSQVQALLILTLLGNRYYETPGKFFSNIYIGLLRTDEDDNESYIASYLSARANV